MGAIISAPIACLGSCAGSCAGTMCCKALSSRISSNRGMKIFYIVIVFLTALSALLVRYQAGPGLAKLSLFSMKSCSTNMCYQVEGVYRICMAMFVFFVLMAGVVTAAPSFHFGHVPLKLLLWIVLLVLSFLIPNDAADIYADISKGGAAIFLLLQIVIFISMSYDWNAWWTGSSERPWLIATVVVSLFFWFGSLIVSAFYYYWFGAGEACGWQQGAITVNIVAAVAYTLLGVSNFAPHGTLLTSSIIFAYCTYTLFGALAAEQSDCTRTGVSMNAFNTYGLVIGAISLCWSAFSVSKATIFGATTEPAHDLPREQPLTIESGDNGEKEVEGESQRWPNVQFHVLMALSAMFMTVTITNWADDINVDSGDFRTGPSVRWVSLVTTWASIVLYLWTLCAPRCCPNRDFGVELD